MSDLHIQARDTERKIIVEKYVSQNEWEILLKLSDARNDILRSKFREKFVDIDRFLNIELNLENELMDYGWKREDLHLYWQKV